MDDIESIDGRAAAGQMSLEREVTDSGRTYQVTASMLPDGRTAISVRCGRADDMELNELSGVIAPEDLPVIARVLKPELASIAAWQGISLDERRYTNAERRREFPKAGSPWTPEEEKLLMERRETGVSVREIARELGRRVGGVNARIDKLVLQSALERMSQTVS